MKTSDDLAREIWGVFYGARVLKMSQLQHVTALIEAHVKAACALATAAERERRDIN